MFKGPIWLSSNFFQFFNFLEHFGTQVYLHFLNQHKILNFLNTQYDLMYKKNSPLRMAVFQIFGHKTPKKEETAENKHKQLFKNSRRNLFPVQKYLRHCQCQLCVCVYVLYMYVYIYIYTHTHKHIYIYIYTYVSLY
jgi:hypothetical protein